MSVKSANSPGLNIWISCANILALADCKHFVCFSFCGFFSSAKTQNSYFPNITTANASVQNELDFVIANISVNTVTKKRIVLIVPLVT